LLAKFVPKLNVNDDQGILFRFKDKAVVDQAYIDQMITILKNQKPKKQHINNANKDGYTFWLLMFKNYLKFFVKHVNYVEK